MRVAHDVSGSGNAFDASPLNLSAPRASRHRRGRLAARALLVVGLLACPLLFERRSAASNPDETDALWVAHAQGAAALALPDASVLLELTDLVDARAVAVDSRRQRVWVYAPGMLRAYSPTGQVLLSAPVPPAGTKADRAALCVTGDGAVWIAVGAAAHLFTDSGQIAATVTLAEQVRSAEADLPRGTLWIGSDETLTAFDVEAGTPLHVIDLGRKAGLTDLGVDAATGEVWIATKDDVRRYAVSGQLVLQAGARKVERIAADELGGAWGLTDK
ncbi:MAG: hypothetical protein ACOY3Y_06380 [Acidobacteriota bacterium]